ncbi:Phosphoenolpyruvate/pyruvate domain-containing protein [Trichoderma citrinoviride]|uniref:Phosphoenolpyruvate/pyruvate domain-containing protein n=1 Tax=Trichoderma citrinoviride TaxID=58853 RepID=A0A2T4BJ46_9HYPO|nr:Phosphoenolpyruvate/pyruvate domain-containing protein [Trichoderma citrinoviride]PTB69342.1 Phosphoenolpyruvate/pyruvate domain-containing protein [Trichoderma citrinoviride]
MATVNQSAQTLKALHKPGTPLVLSNIWDVSSLNAIVSLNSESSKPVKALATASWAIAASLGIKDEELTMFQNLEAISHIAPLAEKAGLPLSVDLQDGYGDYITAAVTAAVEYGAAGANIEDSIPATDFGKGLSGSLYKLDDQVARLKRALEAAKNAGAPDFVLNARCDVFRLEDPDLSHETRLAEAIKRGKAYLEAGATTIFVWGGPGRGLSSETVKTLIKELDGKVAVVLSRAPGALTTSELASFGVSRISVGPSLYIAALEAIKSKALSMYSGGGLA